MRIVVAMKAVPDLVEEIELTPDETDIDREFLKFVLNEWDDQALEEALLVKDETGAEVVAVGLADDPDIDQALYTAIAKGADGAVKLEGGGQDTHSRAAVFAAYLAEEPADVVITGVQAPDDLDGQLAPMLAARLGQRHVSVVAELRVRDGNLVVRQEFAGGRSHELELPTPAVIGLQASREAPRYAPITRIRQAMQAGGVREVTVAAQPTGSGLSVRRMYPPEATGHAEMLSGDTEDVAAKIIELLRERGIVKA
ncbi:electron transfer flavoprotein beta subunit [Saccharomonospora amisosensis]|uniref:Electron transfer flavoprotein beta subunit n=1 Tax=Saccharomonospora amisosensis TaxID=1128677 RepID=A0A7X5URS2_9PSEU|nr:electron transfer flavoprotein subunit beta/FixA family protein [Saccharomonospora amisosensis]NIJ13007.1 electron transfer flavoprotein beta subunit [Saccharomonospora amisosensis]